MQTKTGRHQKWIIQPEHQEKLRVLFLKGFDATMKSPGPAVDIFELADGTIIGAFFRADALGAPEAQKGTWLEFVVDDPVAAATHLASLEVARVENPDTAHAYFQAPGGPVFRLAGV